VLKKDKHIMLEEKHQYPCADPRQNIEASGQKNRNPKAPVGKQHPHRWIGSYRYGTDAVRKYITEPEFYKITTGKKDENISHT
jgi:hypothetical protein